MKRYREDGKSYASDLTDKQWAEIEPLFVGLHTYKWTKRMVEQLHRMGFRVSLWICPCISPDTTVCRDLEKRGFLLLDSAGELAVRAWWIGHSAVRDLSNPGAAAWFRCPRP